MSAPLLVKGLPFFKVIIISPLNLELVGYELWLESDKK